MTYNKIYSGFKTADAPLSQVYSVNEQFETKLLLHGASILKKNSFVQPGDLLHNAGIISDSSPLQYRWHSEWQVTEGGVITPWVEFPPSPPLYNTYYKRSCYT